MSERVEIVNGDSLLVLQLLDDNSVDAIVTDPPYGLAFMGKKWDYDVPSVEVWAECLRVLKPGGHLLAFAGTRTQHRMAVRIEDAGFEIRDMIAWVYGSGFPKSHDVSKAIDKAVGAEREVVGYREHTSKDIRGNASNGRGISGIKNEGKERLSLPYTAPATDAAKQWQGWGTALKPALEPITVARKPLTGTVAENVMEWGTGGLNIDGCRVGTSGARFNGRNVDSDIYGKYGTSKPKEVYDYGRWPANLIHDGSEEVVGLFPDTKSGKMGPWNNRTTNGSPNGIYGKFDEEHPLSETYGDSGSAARFFKQCNHEEICYLCCMPYAEARNNFDIWKNLFAEIAKKNGWTSQATNEFIVRVNAMQTANARLVQNVKYAGNPCDLCATSIAVALVGTKSSDFSNDELQVILGYIIDYKKCILIQSLASFAEIWGNIDTIPTTTSLSILFGSVLHAIENYTKQEKKEKEGEKLEQKRFLYCAKASKRDRDEGNNHPTVKPTDLMRYLCRLVTPPDGTVLDPFMGSGSTGKAAVLEGFRFIGIEREEEYCEIAKARIKHAQQ
jgi:DNA modification methylase